MLLEVRIGVTLMGWWCVETGREDEGLTIKGVDRVLLLHRDAGCVGVFNL